MFYQKKLSLECFFSTVSISKTSHVSDIFPGFLPKYFSSEWSFAQFRVPEDTQFIATFGSQNTVIIVGMDGRCEPIFIHSLQLEIYLTLLLEFPRVLYLFIF